MTDTNEMEVIFDSCSANERFARVAVAAFMTQLNPTVEEVSDVKTAVSEAVTNSIIHGYEQERFIYPDRDDGLSAGSYQDGGALEQGERQSGKTGRCKVSICCRIEGNKIVVIVKDKGKGIEDVQKAMLPMYTTKPELDRSGMGFAFMEAFMDKVEVESTPGKGTTVKMEKAIGKGRDAWTTQSL